MTGTQETTMDANTAPPPYQCAPVREGSPLNRVVDARGRTIAAPSITAGSDGSVTDTATINATMTLFAAAPDMLDALEKLDDVIYGIEAGQTVDEYALRAAMDDARAVIAKARTTTPHGA